MVDRFTSPPSQRSRPRLVRLLWLILALLALASCGAPAVREPGASQTAPAVTAAPLSAAATAEPASGTGAASSASAAKPAAGRAATPPKARAARSTATRPAATQPASRPAGSGQLPAGLTLATPRPGDPMPTVGYAKLPPEAHTTLALIARGGPFPYRQDGVVFQNREGLLSRQRDGYYHEYTVVTPGSPDRGARRIIAGGPGEFYYTGDHYASFRRVVP